MVADFKSRLFADERGKSYLFGQGLNPDNPNSKEVNDFILGMVQPTFNRMQELYGTTVEYSGGVLKDIRVEEKGEESRVISIDPATGRPRDLSGGGSGGGKKSKKSEWEAKSDAWIGFFADKYGEGAIDDYVKARVLEGGDNMEADIDAYLKGKGISPIPGYAGFGAESGTGTEGVPTTVKGLENQYGLVLDPNKTKVFEKDGTLYLVTIEEDLINNLAAIEDALGKKEVFWDSDVRTIVGAVDDPTNPKHWNTGPFEGNTFIYNLGPAKGNGLSTDAQLQEGDEQFISLSKDDEFGKNIPRKGDFEKTISKGLVRRSIPVLNQYDMWVTDTSDSKRHKSAAQVKYRTGYDVNFKREAGRGPGVLPFPETRPLIAKAVLDFRKQGLTATYEVKTKEFRDALLQESKEKGWGLTPDMIIAFAGASGNHFSVSCPDCVKYTDVYPEGEGGGDAESSAAEDTEIQTAVKPRTAEQILEDRLKAGEKIDISNQ